VANPRWRRLLGFFGSLLPGGSWTKVRVSHEHIEVVQQADATGLRLSQEAVETVYTPDGTVVQLSQEAVEVVGQEVGTNVRLSQECIEVVYGYVCEELPPDAPPAPAPCSTDPVPDLGWTPGPCTGRYRGE
jgi:PAS domain-containing protein